MSDGRVVIDIDADIAKFKNAVKGLGGVVASGTKAVGVAAAAGLGVAVAGLTAVATKSVMLASDLQEVQNVVDTTFGKNADAIDAWAKGAGTAFGLSELSAKKYSSTLGAMMKSQGLSADATRDMSTSLSGLSGDFASFYNLAPEEAFEKIRAGISGESEPLKQLGIDLSETAVAAFALAQGIKKPYSEMSAGEKTQMRYQALMAQSKDAQGDFAKTSDSFANQLRILKMNLESIGASIGAVLLPIASEGLGALKQLLDELTPGFEQTFKGLAGIFKGEAGATDQFESGIQSIATGLAGALEKMLPPLTEAAVSLMTALFEALPGIITTLTPVIVDGFAKIVEALPVILPPLTQALVTLFTLLASELGEMAPVLVPVVVDALLQMVDVLYENAPLFGDAAWQLIQGLLLGLWEALPELLATIWNLAAALLMAISEFFGIRSPSTVFATIGRNLIEGLRLGIVTAWNAVKAWFAGLKARVLSAIGAVSAWLKAKGLDILSGLLSGIVSKYADVRAWLSGLGAKVKSAVGTLGSLLKDAGRKIIQGLWDGMKELWEDCKSWVTGIADWIQQHKGPLSVDYELLQPAGRAIMAGFLDSLREGWVPVERQLQGFTAQLSGELGDAMGSRVAKALSVSPGFVPAAASYAPTPGSFRSSAAASVAPAKAHTELNIVVQNPMGSYSDGLRAWRDIQEGIAW